MVNIYENIRGDSGDIVRGRTKLFIKNTETDGSIGEFLSGDACVPEGNGTMFIVDDWLIPQIDKILFVDGALSVKDGEGLIPPVKTEKELQREELLKQLAELDSQPSE